MRLSPFKTSRVKMSIMKLSYFKQYYDYIAILGAVLIKKMQLDTNSKLNLVQTLTLSNGDRNN